MAVQSSLVLENQIISPERNQQLEYLRRWGGSSTNSILDHTTKIFTTPGVKGLIGYRDHARCAVAYGDPVCASQDIPILTQAFHDYCAELGKGIVYIAASQSFAAWSNDQGLCNTCIEFGVELTLNPQIDPKKQTGSNAQLLRGKTHQAERAGITVHEYYDNNKSIENQIEAVARGWLAGRKGPQVFIGNVNIFDDRYGKRWLYAKMQDTIVGFVMLNQLKERGGWFLDKLITSQAPNGTSELLVTTAMDILRDEGCEFITVGPAPIAELGEIIGLSKTSTWLARKGYSIAYRMLHLGGRRKFWEKYHPQSEPCYLLFSKKGLGIKELIGLRRSLNISL